MRWAVKTAHRTIEVVAETAEEAMDVLRDEPLTAFGLIVFAQPIGRPEEESVGIRTATLFGKRWGKPDVARQVIELAMASGLPDTTEFDL